MANKDSVREGGNSKLTIVAVGYNYRAAWLGFLSSLVLQTSQDWECVLLNDGPDEHMERTVQKFCTDMEPHYGELPIKTICTPDRANRWGHNLRKLGLAGVSTEFVAITNADNYYVPRFVEIMLNTANNGNFDVVLCPIVHNYPNVNFNNDPAYSVLKVEPALNHWDWHCGIIRTELAQKVGINHIDQYGADGLFINEVMQRNPRWTKVPHILGVHN